ncbi:hypothetical protein Acj9p140 [Acinetobacter phage Acj9]|uniref:Uncharacterized protein n=1 Tax=Acinetobacter phage Acj9 TaxID=760939 RepID=E5EPS4_9CAUD|nr:hypothetical protein Acj9p140 [Acinetobacter phage Acj9]ADG60040.1 hypothetical protein Acj9p140 [Acinetobacter phage Acj9]
MFGLKKPQTTAPHAPFHKMFAAVHLVTESSDHYNMLVEHANAQEILDYIKSEMGDELAYVCNWWISAEDVSIADYVSNNLEELINEVQDADE